MMKLSRSMLSRKWVGVREALGSHSFESRAAISSLAHDFAAKGTSAAGVSAPYTSVNAPYTIYKGKAALSLKPLLPTFSKLDSGILRIHRQGSMMLTFWPAVGERKYDWGKKQSFALSATEVGSLISMGAHDASEFFHDPSMKSSNAGQVTKKLYIKALDGGSGYMISLTVTNNILKSTERFNVPVTTAEFAVLRTACSFALPHIIGWDWMANQSLKGAEGSSSKLNLQPKVLDSEWDR